MLIHYERFSRAFLPSSVGIKPFLLFFPPPAHFGLKTVVQLIILDGINPFVCFFFLGGREGNACIGGSSLHVTVQYLVKPRICILRAKQGQF